VTSSRRVPFSLSNPQSLPFLHFTPMPIFTFIQLMHFNVASTWLFSINLFLSSRVFPLSIPMAIRGVDFKWLNSLTIVGFNSKIIYPNSDRMYHISWRYDDFLLSTFAIRIYTLTIQFLNLPNFSILLVFYIFICLIILSNLGWNNLVRNTKN